MRIAYFTDTFTPELNGVTNTLSRLRSYLERKGIHYAFFAPDYNRKAPRENSREGREFFQEPGKPGGGGVHRFRGIKISLSPESCLAFPPARDIFARCDSFKPDLVHVITELGIGYRGLSYAHSRGLPLVMSYHTDYCQYLPFFHLDFIRPLVEKYLAWFYHSAHKILAPSRHTLEQLVSRQYRNLGIWSRGIDTDKFNPRHRSRGWRKSLGIDDKFVFLYVGRLSPEKGLDMLIHAGLEIEKRFPGKSAFVFTGGGPCEALIRRENSPHMILTGFKTGGELSQIYASADCFAFPSPAETFGNAPLEAMASGLPVAAIASGGVLEFLSHGHNALLSAPGDQGAFTANLLAVMAGAGLRRRLAENGRVLARGRTWDRIFDDLLRVYASLAGDSGLTYRDAS
ncbi:MAG: glycosyltransferase family 1 protein [Treponema sp.]|jgi:glycosyltransferase involved in cell wall biosynthesis|nr:glycosyltransferase family 1 protein [Treponema sp.]